MRLYKPAEAATITGASKASMRKYAIQFPDHFSAHATPSPGSARAYTDDDLRVIRFIWQATDGGATIAEVKTRLDSGEIEDFPWHPPRTAAPEPAEEYAETQPLASLVISQLSAQLDAARQREVQLQDHAREREETLHNQITQLERALGEAQGQLRILQRPWWRRLLGQP